MNLCLDLKLECHLELKECLLATGDARIVENGTLRPQGSAKFWGAELVDGQWQGSNVLGKLWMNIQSDHRKHSKKIPDTGNFYGVNVNSSLQ